MTEGDERTQRSPASEAMDRYAEGDEAAFGALYDELAPRLLRYLDRLTKRRAVAEDLLQQAFLQMHQARGRFQAGAAVEPWAYAIARRLFLGWQRSAWREVHPDGAPERSEYARDAESDFIVQELADELSQELARMSPILREAFLLMRIERLSAAEAAEVLGTTVTAVKLRAHRGGNMLRDLATKRMRGDDGE